LVDNVVRDSTVGTESVQNYIETGKNIAYFIELTKLVGLQLHAVTKDYVITGIERTELSNKASQQEGVLRITRAKVLKIQLEAEHVEGALDRAEAYSEMVQDVMIDYDAVILELKQCNLRYEDLEAREKCLKKQFYALSSQIAKMKRGEVGVNLRLRPLWS